MPNISIKKTVYFVSHSIYPVINSGGGSIVLYRHLKRLKTDGYRIIFIHSQQSPPSKYKTEFEEIQIKKRKWFPPLRVKTPILTSIRINIYFSYIKELIKPNKDDIVLSTLGDYTNLLALKISQYYNIPLFMIYHDDCLFNNYFNQNLLSKTAVKNILKYSTHIFAVSESMKELLQSNGAPSVSVLYPIPEGYNKRIKSWSNTNNHQQVFCNSGAIFEEFHMDLIQKISLAVIETHNRVVFLSRGTKEIEQKTRQTNSIAFFERIEKTEDLFNYFIKEVDILLVFYSFNSNEELRLYHSFPSKFVEYCFLGIPILIIAPACSAIGKWAIKNNWLSYVSNDSIEDICQMMNNFRKEYFWKNCSRQSIEIAHSLFNPDKIHKHFINTMFHFSKT